MAQFNICEQEGIVSLTYKIPKPFRKPFVVGEIVEVCDRDLVRMSFEKVIRVGKKVVVTASKRRWRASDGWWIGTSDTWPFPSIRHARKSQRPGK